ncbi:sulfite reductase (NADPH) flavoprotein alpha-component [Methylomarinovum tepidoasis]|uniref:assimilatory sulfite reductase (NADPH) n=1 Tax=Methylomarinovum tepidoasis TaxID=2840183 RepID=A0AAU9D2B1_9GAMM|nr:flavodoxin domain-containing protein [Methylomarinovum sp. IN45]BCX89124.1 sulfite reductase (NADPH) flavoprotein alpha-component [Methylomarinovum sp. IN45]
MVQLVLIFTALWAAGAAALERHADPDGCLSCHSLPGLEYFDDQGVRRTATILKEAYYGSLHGSVPCRDCHRKIRDYPHDPKNGYVDCSASCHVEEPSEGKRFSHKDIVEEFKKSVHGMGKKAGWTKDFHGGNRLEEVENQQNPSCRYCHYNEPYIPPHRLAQFMEAFGHVDTECGSCHQGEVWRDQFGGHILRRLIGNHYSKNDANALCVCCHGDHKKMKAAKIRDLETGEMKPAAPRFVFAVDSYAKFLHARLLEVGVEDGASCIDCHAPEDEGFRHGILSHRDPKASTHPDHLADTCGQSGCHGDYAKNPLNRGFLLTDMHDMAWVPLDRIRKAGFDLEVVKDSPWWTVVWILGPLAALFLVGQALWWLWENRDEAVPILGGGKFRTIMLEMPAPPAWWRRLLGSEEEAASLEPGGDLDDHLVILYGSQTGNAEGVAEQLFHLAERWQLPVRLIDMAELEPKELARFQYLFVLTSTQGEGEPPLNAQNLHRYLKELSEKSHEKPLLPHLHYAVFGLGDSSYTYFCQCGKDFDAFLEKLGGERVLPRVDADVDYEEPAAEWLAKVIEIYRKLSGHEGVEPPPEKAPAESGYGKQRPYPAPVLVNRNLNGPGSAKETRHIEFSLEGSGLSYEPGDVLGVYPTNPPAYVEDLLRVLGWSGYEEVELSGERLSLREAFFSRLDITSLTRPLLEKYAEASGAELQPLLADAKALEDYLWGRQLIDLVEDYPPKLDPQAFVALLRKLPPRLYSISSSPRMHPGQVHLTVGVVRYHSHGRDREGICSNYLARRRPGETALAFVQVNDHFRLPQDGSADVIMVGSGTGIAPFRAFLEEREASGAAGRNWLFFGDQHQATDFLYAEELEDKRKRGVLTRLSLAFSRDQERRIYVQHRMQEEAVELYAWLEGGAYFYVCGDASRMAKDVHCTLVEILMGQGGLSEEKAEAYLKTMEQEGRYQRDVY